MRNIVVSLQDWGIRIILSLFFKKFYVFDRVKLEVKNFETDGLILDIGGGGEGVIGRLKGSQVIAIDLRKDELDGIIDGPHKIVMDARLLAFPDNSFATATAFFSMMYLKNREDHQQVLIQTWRVLKPAGHLLIWDIDLQERPKTSKEFYLVRLRYQVGTYIKETGYGVKWPDVPRREAYYIQLARKIGFNHLTTERFTHLFYLELVKPG
jgi:ubiquinone/menaquinone biosynthesis C-methylase UbiE